jgi:plastocyanin domain-containing protein
MLLAALASAALSLPALAGDAPAAGKRVEIKVTRAGFEPRQIKLKKGEPVTLVFTRTTEETCITAVDIPDEGVQGLDLPLGKPVSVTLTPKKAGTEPFHCTAMGMGNGKLIVRE